MKTLFTYPRFKTLNFTLILILTFIYATNAQVISTEKEYFKEQAAEIIPGAEYVKIMGDSPFPAFVKFSPASSMAHSDFFSRMKTILKTDSNLEFELMKQEADNLGFEHYRYRQLYNNIPLDQTMFILHVKDGQVISFNGATRNIRDATTIPDLSKEEALDLALQYIGSDRYMWEDDFWEKDIKEHTEDPNATYFPKGELVFSPIDENAPTRYLDNPKLAYVFNIASASPHKEQRVCIDAINGTILYDTPLESNCNPTTVNTVFNGVRNISTDMFTGSDFRMRDDCQAAVIRVRDWGSLTTTESPVEIENTTNSWTTQDERFSGSVLWCTKQSYNYFLNIHSRNSYDHANGNVNGFINAIFSCAPPPPGCTTANNASMSFTGGFMKVGLSNAGVLTNSYATIDIIGHEYAHAVTGSTAMLVYEDEWGALNESFSDIFGEAIEFFTFGSNDWLIGAERDNGAIRSMSNPNAGNDPDTYLGTNWVTITPPCNNMNDECGVHTNSGVQNFWFFLLSEGGSGTNDNGDDYTVCGIGLAAAEAIAFRNLTVYLGMNSSYSDARTGSIAAAQDIYGVGSNEAIQVANAWYAVGVGAGADAFSVGCPAAILGTIECHEPIPPAASTLAQFTALGGSVNGQLCGPVSVLSNDVFSPPGDICNGQRMTRTYTISDGFSSGVCMQALTILAPDPPTINCPANITISCNESDDPSETGMATGAVLCGSPPSLDFSDMVVSGNCNWECTIERTWTAEDDCGNTSDCVQTIMSSPLLLIQQALSMDLDMDGFPDPIVLGGPGVSLTLTLADAECIVEWLSAGYGNAAPAAIPWGNHFNDVPTCIPGSNIINPDGTMANPLLANAIFMAINLRLNPTLGEMLLSDTGVPVDMVVIISMPHNSTVSDLFRLTNIALWNLYAPHLDLLNTPLQGINEMFHFCEGGVGSIVSPLIENSLDIQDNIDLSTQTVISSDGISIYPNPAGNEVYLDINGYTGQSGTIEIYNLQGQRMLVQKIASFSDTPYHFILDRFENSVYLAVIQSANSGIQTKKFLVKK